MTIAQRVREVRVAHHLTHAEFAEKLEEAYHRINDIERGKQRTPAEFVSKIVNVFNIDAHWILTGEGNMFTTAQLGTSPVWQDSEQDCVDVEYMQLSSATQEQSLDAICHLLMPKQRQELCARLNEMLRLNQLEAMLRKSQPPRS